MLVLNTSVVNQIPMKAYIFSNHANYGIRHSFILSDGAKPVTE